jgi:O-antigen ligase
MSLYFAQSSSRPGFRQLLGLASLVLTANLAGFQTISFIPGGFGVDQTAATVPFRALEVVLLMYAFYKLLAVGHLRSRISVTTILVVLFWFAYSVRFMVDAVLLQVPLKDPAMMALYIFGIIIPMFTICYLVGDINLYMKALPWIMLLLGASCAFAVHRLSVASDIDIAQHGRLLGNELLNPIEYGHMGVRAIVLGLFVLLRIGRVNRSWYLRIAAAGTVCVGIFTVLTAESRGAMVAAALLVPFVLYLGVRRGSRTMSVAICVAGLFVASATLGYLAQQGRNTVRTLASGWAYSSGNNSVSSRQTLFRDAFLQYSEHPVFGSSIVEKNSRMYPHNALIEAFMATGTLFGSIFILIVIIAVWRAIKLVSRNTAMSWVPICFFQTLIGAMFSGGLYQNPVMWGMMAIMLGVDMPPKRFRKAEILAAQGCLETESAAIA